MRVEFRWGSWLRLLSQDLFSARVEYIEIYPEKFLQVVLEVVGDEEDCVAIIRCLAVNFVYL